MCVCVILTAVWSDRVKDNSVGEGSVMASGIGQAYNMLQARPLFAFSNNVTFQEKDQKCNCYYPTSLLSK